MGGRFIAFAPGPPKNPSFRHCEQQRQKHTVPVPPAPVDPMHGVAAPSPPTTKIYRFGPATAPGLCTAPHLNFLAACSLARRRSINIPPLSPNCIDVTSYGALGHAPLLLAIYFFQFTNFTLELQHFTVCDSSYCSVVFAIGYMNISCCLCATNHFHLGRVLCLPFVAPNGDDASACLFFFFLWILVLLILTA